MLAREKNRTLLRTFAIAAMGLTLPFLWPGVLPNLLAADTLSSGHAASLPPTLGTLTLGSDLLIGVSYTVIASILAAVVYQHRRVLPFDWVVLAFGLFIVACGFTHFMHVVTRFVPLWWLDGYVRAVTAIVSLATAVALPPLVPRISALLNAERQVQAQQQALERANAALQDAVARAEQLAAEAARQRDALAATNELLRRSNAELEQFAYVASHDLQAPIRAVTSFADAIDRRYGAGLDERGRVYLRQVVDNGQHMKRLVDDLLAYSRLTTQPRGAAPVEVDAVFDAVAARLRAASDLAEVSLSRGDLPVVMADAQRVDQVLQNLMSNGLKYRRDGVVPEVRVWASREGAFWHFRVSDNGIGIAPEYFERIFVIFQRLHTRERFEGTGIGLAVCKKIVEGFGGRIWLESTLGAGSTFHFTLPATPESTA